MTLVHGKGRVLLRAGLSLAVAMSVSGTAMAQNKKGSWEVFLYFGSFFANDVPSATQFGDVTTYRVDPAFAQDPYDPNQVIVNNIGLIGGDQPPDPNYPFTVEHQSQFLLPPCQGDVSLPGPGDPRAPYYDECDPDSEARYLYNASGMKTNGEIQKDDSEFTLGLRGGYNITRHWEIEFDIGFGKQRIDLTKSLDPLLTARIGDITDPRAGDLADFFEFTWANTDYMNFRQTVSGTSEMPAVIASRHANDPAYNIPIYFPDTRPGGNYPVPNPEVFDDVTGFINRVFQDPTAFRNRGNQINIDTFTISASVNYNFNTKADSRIVPYLSAGFGRWIRNFDEPYDGGDTNFLNGGAGIRFFVNEIFSFRADLRYVSYLDDSFTIEAGISGIDLIDVEAFGGCLRDQLNVQPPCPGATVDPNIAFPNIDGGGNATIEVEAELADFFELRIGFGVILGGK